jgi:threonylcarbamoyladenosine tRNA methylthiotransferase MtaB
VADLRTSANAIAGPDSADRPRRVAFNTLGCKLNQYETDALASRFIQQGYEVVSFDSPADAYIINTCTVTNKADRKTRNTINRAIRLSGKLESLDIRSVGGSNSQMTPTAPDRPNSSKTDTGADSSITADIKTDQRGAMVVVTGCFVDSHKDELEADGRSFVVDNERKNSIFELVDGHLRGEIVHPESLQGDRFAYAASRQVFRTRGMVKIQDGCDNFCSFCIIPFVRGTAISRDPAEIIDSAQRMLDEGYRELVLTGVNMSRYEHGDTRFSHIVDSLLNLEGDYRLRISSIEPDQLDDRFIELMKHPRMTPHLHLCLQSGSEKILLKMRRQYSYAQYLDIVRRIRRDLPEFNITTDIIVGFPGEGESEFNESLEALRTIGFGHVHAFKYSVRKGTRAERMDGKVDEKTKSARSESLRIAAEAEKNRYRRGFIGRNQRVLVERTLESGGKIWARGLGEHYIPVTFPLPGSRDAASFLNQYIDVTVTGIEDGDDPQLIAEIRV